MWNVAQCPPQTRRLHDENNFWIISISAILRINRFSTQTQSGRCVRWLVPVERNVHLFSIELYLSSIKRLLRKLDEQWYRVGVGSGDEWKKTAKHARSAFDLDENAEPDFLQWPRPTTMAPQIHLNLKLSADIVSVCHIHSNGSQRDTRIPFKLLSHLFS